MEYKYFLFDWDGCVAKTLEVWLESFREAYMEYGATPSDLEIANHFGDWESPKHFGIKDVKGCVQKAVELADKGLKEVELYPGAKNLLEELSKSDKLALLSSSERRVLNWGLEHNQIIDIFDVIISGDEVQNHKPHPEVIEKGLAALGGNKNDAVMIGDSRKDLEAAKNAGVDSILVYPESHKIFYDLEELKKYRPTQIVTSFKELKAKLATNFTN